MRISAIAVAAMVVVLPWTGTSKAVLPSLDPNSRELIVKFHGSGDDVIFPEEALDVVTNVSDPARNYLSPVDWALYTRLGSPVSARWLIELRLDDEYIVEIEKLDPDHPESRLQEFVILRYSDAGSQAVARERLSSDASVSSVVTNSKGTYSLRVNDYYVAVTGAGQIPGGYQWALEDIGAMSPWTNPTAQSAWDKATGFGYVAIVDSGIMRAHPDLQQNFKAHFSQAFYSGGCYGSAVEVDESGGLGTNCPNTYRGHGTHVAGIVAATPNNAVGVAGVCWDCSIVIAKTFAGDAVLASDRISAFNHAVVRGTQVVNLSGGDNGYFGENYGIGVKKCEDLPNGGAQDAYCSVLALMRLREILFVAASGNENSATATDFPAREQNVVSVAATKYDGTLWYAESGGTVGSSLGKVQFVAPGARVVSSFYDGYTWSDVWPDPWKCEDVNGLVGYDQCTGTSMAAPHVTAMAAVVRSINPFLSAVSLTNLLIAASSNVSPPAGVSPPGGYFKKPNLLTAVNQAINNGYTWPAFAMVTSGSSSNRFTTSAPQMARAAIGGHMLPTLNQSTTPVYYVPDTSAPVVSGYTAFPDSIMTPRAYFKVYTKLKVAQTTLKPLYRLSKLQDTGSGTDECGTPMPVPSKPVPVIHIYTTSKTERNALTAATYGNCYKYDGVEGYVAPSNLGGLQQLYRLYNPTADSWILVPANRVSTATGLGYTQNQSSLGWVVPN